MNVRNFLILLLLGTLGACSFDETEFVKPVTKTSTSNSITSVSFVASWKRMLSAKAYVVDVAEDAEFQKFLPDYRQLLLSSPSPLFNNPDTFVLVTGLSPNTTYYYRVKAVIGDQQLAYSSNFFVKTLNLSAPIALAETYLSSRGFVANWEPVDGASVYEITIATDEEFKQVLDGFEDLEVDDLQVEVTGLEPNTNYYYRLKAKSLNSISLNSNVIQIATPSLETIIAREATAVTKNSFIANWVAIEGATSYLIDISLNQDFTFFLAGYMAKEVVGTSLTVENLSAKTKYYYRLRAKTGGYISGNSKVIEVETDELGVPLVLPAESVEFDSFIANWISGDAYTNTFLIEVAKDIDFIGILPEYNNRAVLGNNILVSELEPGTTYYYRVKGIGLNSLTAYSEIQTVYTPLLDAPIQLGYKNRKAFTFSAQWAAVDGATSYLFTLATDPGFNNIVAGYDQFPILDTQLDVRVTTFDKPLYYRVQAIHHEFMSDYSKTQYVPSAFSTGCRLEKLSFADSEQILQYDGSGRCEVVKYYKNGYLDLTTTLFYTNADKLPNKITYVSDGYSKITLLEISSNTIVGLVNYVDGILETTESWVYDGRHRLVARIVYGDLDKVNQLYRYDFSYDAFDRIVGVNKDGGFYRAYRYDDKLSPWALGDVPSFLYLKSVLGEYCLFEHRNNITVEDFGTTQIVSSFDYDANDLAIRGLGLYNWNATFTNCDASK